MPSTEELRAQLAMVELEERLVALKADPDTDPEVLAECKVALREARVRFRTFREGGRPEPAPGDAVATPGTVATSATVERPGGEQ